jgi:hypothetical protein
MVAVVKQDDNVVCRNGASGQLHSGPLKKMMSADDHFFYLYYLMRRPFFKIPLVCLLVCVAAYSSAQKRRAQILQAKIASGYGTVENLEGEVFEGKVTFNDNVGVVTVAGNGESRSFTAKKAVSFRFDDQALSRRRIFHVFDYSDKETGFTNPAFFEVLGEFEAFAVLSKPDPVEVMPKKGIMPRAPSTMTMTSSDATKIAFQEETIFVMNDKGELEPYMVLTETETEGVFWDTRSNQKRFVDSDLLQQYTGIHFEKLKAFAKANDLSFKAREDLVKILAHYKTLLAN